MRGPWLTSVFGLVLLVGIPVEFVTGLLSYAAYDPRLGNDPNPDHGLFGLYLFNWVTTPGLALPGHRGHPRHARPGPRPVVLAKLWSVMPKLFAWPPWRSVAQLLERLSLVLVVGGVVFEMVTGILYIDYDNRTNFYSGHFYGAWAFMAGFAVHVCVKFGDMVGALRSRDACGPNCGPGWPAPGPSRSTAAWSPPNPAPPTISRRGILALVGGTSLAVFVLTAGESIGGAMRQLALFGTHYRSPGSGANHFPVNHTAASRRHHARRGTGPDWRLSLVGTGALSLSREQLLAMPLTTADLPIACTEGWSTQQRWTGVPLGRPGPPGRCRNVPVPLQHQVARHRRRDPVRRRRCRRLIRCWLCGSTAPTFRSTTGSRPGSSSRLRLAPTTSSGCPRSSFRRGVRCDGFAATTAPARSTSPGWSRVSPSPPTHWERSSARAGGRRSWRCSHSVS